VQRKSFGSWSFALVVVASLLRQRISSGGGLWPRPSRIVRLDAYEAVKKDFENHKGARAEVAAYFFLENGAQLRDTNGKYSTVAGYVAVAKGFVPRGKVESRIWNPITLFIPYSELHLPRGFWTLKLIVVLWDKNGREVARSKWVPFVFYNM